MHFLKWVFQSLQFPGAAGQHKQPFKINNGRHIPFLKSFLMIHPQTPLSYQRFYCKAAAIKQPAKIGAVFVLLV